MNSTIIPDLYYDYLHHLPFGWPEVLRMEGQRNYTVFVLTHGQRFTSTRSLCVYEPHLPEYLVRVHKRTVINRAYIKTCHRPTKTFTLSDGTIVQAARRRWGEIKALLTTRA
jgi:DNA-binding LytR/AlgR family response regulator